MKTEHTVQNADLTDEWAQRFLHDVRAALDATEAAERANTVVVDGDASWLVEETK